MKTISQLTLALIFLVFSKNLTAQMNTYPSVGDAASVYSSMQMNNMQGLYMINSMQRTFSEQNNAHNAAVKPHINSTALSPNTLNINPNPTITKLVREQIINNISKSAAEGVATKTDKMLGNIETTFAKMINPYGLQANSYADVLATYLVVMWMSVNKQTQLPESTKVKAVAMQCKSILLANNDFAKLSARQKQWEAEIMMYQACFNVLIRQEAVRNSDTKMLSQLSASAAASLAKQNLHLDKLSLTNKGFEENKF
ncbi:MAG: hypothetical protein JSU03_02320 [Bacteroidetes bacterium]|nr:hypothetical protein [Bacteroidota bacterium]